MDDSSGIYAASETGLAIAAPGLVYRTDMAVHILFPDGRYRYDWPDQGLAGDFSRDQERNLGFWGRWRGDGNRIEIERQQGVVSFQRRPDAIIDKSGKAFVRLPDQQAGFDPTGVWTRESSVSDRPRIDFLSDGRFDTSGGLLGLIAMPEFVMEWRPYPPDSLFQWPDGGGRYTLEGYTLSLVRDDGPRLNMLALAVSDNRVRLGFTWFNRSGG